ncbi:hypothetical protein DAEQUDRAFT_727531 [Daedalea quercina L-15889]|uniref:Uncharacterized protein n=1 Tax=Daedalea quercina L-15889 TaxID=1314783 RepID=A0A165PV73_9APHY|nr:hypothetical protein DAEQUDRAFT_727531 [Daedalea quercina L-15889]
MLRQTDVRLSSTCPPPSARTHVRPSVPPTSDPPARPSAGCRGLARAREWAACAGE